MKIGILGILQTLFAKVFVSFDRFVAYHALTLYGIIAFLLLFLLAGR